MSYSSERQRPAWFYDFYPAGGRHIHGGPDQICAQGTPGGDTFLAHLAMCPRFQSCGVLAPVFLCARPKIPTVMNHLLVGQGLS